MYCICCKKNNVKPTDYYSGRDNKTEEELLWEKNKGRDGSITTINNGMVDNGIIQIIDAGYGSSHDGDQIIIAVCDECISINLEDATLLYWGNYMPGHDDWISKDIEKSKKLYRRRKNLDGLV